MFSLHCLYSTETHRPPRSLPQESDLPVLAEQLHQRLVKQMALNVRRLDVVYAVMAAAARTGARAHSDVVGMDGSARIHHGL